MNFGEELAATFKDLRAYSIHLTRHPEEAKDLVQDTLLRAWQSQHLYVPGSNLRAWVCSVMHNLHINNLRYRQVREKHRHKLMPVGDSQPASQEIYVQLRETISAMATLDPDEQSAIVAGAMGVSHDDRGIPSGTSKSRCSRGRQRLMELMG